MREVYKKGGDKKVPSGRFHHLAPCSTLLCKQIHKYTNTQIHKYKNTKIQKYTNTTRAGRLHQLDLLCSLHSVHTSLCCSVLFFFALLCSVLLFSAFLGNKIQTTLLRSATLLLRSTLLLVSLLCSALGHFPLLSFGLLCFGLLLSAVGFSALFFSVLLPSAELLGYIGLVCFILLWVSFLLC